MRTLFLIISLIMATALQAEQPQMITPKSVEEGTAKMVFKNKIEHLGELDFKEEYTHFFEFKNEGNTTLKVLGAFTPMGESEVHSYSEEVAPGETGWVNVTFKSKDYIGKFAEYFYIRSNSNGVKTLSRIQINYEIFEYLTIGGDYVASSDNVNIRALPSTESPVVFKLSKGESCKLVNEDVGDYVSKFDDAFWYEIEYLGQKGWVLSSLTEF